MAPKENRSNRMIPNTSLRFVVTCRWPSKSFTLIMSTLASSSSVAVVARSECGVVQTAPDGRAVRELFLSQGAGQLFQIMLDHQVKGGVQRPVDDLLAARTRRSRNRGPEVRPALAMYSPMA